jgi:Periplasmic binding protein
LSLCEYDVLIAWIEPVDPRNEGGSMQQRTRRIATVAFAVALGAAACSSSGDDDATTTADGSTSTPAPTEPGDVPEGSTVGISDTEIKVSLIYSDNAALAEAGIVPDIGDPVEDYGMFFDEANEAGGAGGLTFSFTAHDFPPGAPATDQQPACVAATEDDDAAIVIYLGGMSEEVVLCAGEEHERIAYVMAGALTQDAHDRSEGRLFNHNMSADRLVESWVRALEAGGTLEGATLGMVRMDRADQERIASALKTSLEARGLELAEEVALPCDVNSCEQSDLAVERLSAAGVDHVFSTLGALAYPSLVTASQAAGFAPQWLSSDIENQVFDVTAQFMESVKDGYDGAIGFSTGLEEPASDPFGEDCNARFSAATGKTYDYDTDKWRLVRTSCGAVGTIVAALNHAQETYGVVNQATIIEGFEAAGPPTLGDQVATWSQSKHDGANVGVLKEFSAACLCWTEIEGTRQDFAE